MGRQDANVEEDDKLITPDYVPRPLQLQLSATLRKYRWAVIVTHRRFGKTIWAINQLIEASKYATKDNPRYAYVAPTYTQGKAIAWDFLKHYSRHVPGMIVHESELRVDFPTGARIRIYGADKPDALRGLYLDGAILDEYAQMAPRTFSEILRPALSDRNGWCYFIGTPQGKNALYEQYKMATKDPAWFSALFTVADTQLIPAEELASARAMMSEAEYAQEFMCSFTAAISGAYFAVEMADARATERICNVAIMGGVPVDTWWDIGMDDSTAIWFSQTIGREIHLVDYYESSGVGLPHYAEMLRDKAYHYGNHYGPHDIQVREFGPGKSRWEQALELGIRYKVVPRVEHKPDSIEAARRLLARCWFDADRCELGVEHLESYRKKWDEINRVWQAHPLHDHHSNGADAFQTLAMGHPHLPQQSIGATPASVGLGRCAK